VKPIGSAETRLGPIPNVPDGIPGIGGIGSVEMPGVGVLSPGVGGLAFPSAPALVQPAPSSTAVPTEPPVGAQPAPEVTPFPTTGPQPSATPTPGPAAVPAPTSSPVATAHAASTPTPMPSGAPVQQPQQGSPYSTPPIVSTQVPSLVQTPYSPVQTAGSATQNPLAATFGQYLKDAVANFNKVQRLATGDKVDIHDVTLALQKASITSQLAIQVRNRLVEAYQEVMRMPV